MHIKNESLLFCLVFKSGTTSLFYNINRWAGYSSDEILDQKTDNLMLARRKYPWENPKVLQNTMKNTYSFIVVRHPFLRLISAYEERLLEQVHPYYKNLSHQIYKKYHNDGIEFGIPSFQDFVQYIIDHYKQHPQQKLDLHVTQINELCSPCRARYDAILKLETFAQDISYLATQTHLQHKIKPVHMNHSRRDSTDRLIQKYFSQITRQQFFDLFSIYMIDFQLFNYSADGYLQHTKP
ncbi:carbohydrate sulfotransferase 11-like [Anopheles darlingi]|uniref:carbohydrate sulfotransferase 11-like n=1 Tax=Anopheles darlingi TaxID=43151 RepID=UPI0021003AB3|nr:carbohydrate sulfotransferase 11-like [Anopheles darlingi]